MLNIAVEIRPVVASMNDIPNPQRKQSVESRMERVGTSRGSLMTPSLDVMTQSADAMRTMARLTPESASRYSRLRRRSSPIQIASVRS
jgi:hypothetical protein